MPHKAAARYLRENLAVAVLIFSAVVNTILVVAIIVTNTHRINDIERLNHQSTQNATEQRLALARGLHAAAVSSCRQTYEGVRLIFQPFTTPLKTQPQARGRVRKFNVRVNQLKAGCTQQIAPTREVAP